MSIATRLHKVNLDSQTLLEHLRDLDEVARTKLLRFSARHKISGNEQTTVRRLIHLETIKSHLQKARSTSSRFMYGMMGEDMAADFIRGKYRKVAKNFGYMGISHGLAKIANVFDEGGARFMGAGQILLGNSLRISAPFLRRGTSLLIVSDLVDQVKALRSGNRDTLASIIGDSITIGDDLLAAGIEVAEISFETMAILGISAVTGPANEAVAAIVMLGVRIYEADQKVAYLDHLVHLSSWEKFKEGWRAFLAIEPEEYIKKMADLVAEYERLLAEKLKFLKNHPEIKYLIFPALERSGEECHVVIKWRFCGGGVLFVDRCESEETVCEPVFSVIKDNAVYFNNKRYNFYLDQVKPINPDPMTEIICLPTGNVQGIPDAGAYQCNGALGLATTNHTVRNIALFDLLEGEDQAVGFLNMTNIFKVGNGFKNYTGGREADFFILQANEIEGDFDGGEAIDTLDISVFQARESIKIRLNDRMVYNNKTLNLRNIENLIENIRDVPVLKSVVVACNTSRINIQGGTIETTNKILIPQDDDCDYTIGFLLNANTDLLNQAKKGNFNYDIQLGTGITSVNFTMYLPVFLTLSRHQFILNTTVSNLASLQHFTMGITPPLRHHIKFYFLDDAIRKLLRTIHTISFDKNNTDTVAHIHYQLKSGFSLDVSLESYLPKTLKQTLSQKLLQKNLLNHNLDHFNITVSSRHKIRHIVLNLLESSGFGKPLDNFRLDVRFFSASNTFFYFKDGVELKIGDKNIYLFHNTQQSIPEIINTYSPIARRLKMTCVIYTLQNELVLIGHGKHEVIHNDPHALKSHLIGNGGENLFVITSGARQLPPFPLNEVVLYHFKGDNHTDSLDLRALTAQVNTELNVTMELAFVPGNEENSLRNDLLLSLAIKSRSEQSNAVTKIISIRLRDALMDRWYEDFHIILKVAPMKIVGSRSNLYLEPIPLQFNEYHELISIGVKDVEKDTRIIVPEKFNHEFFRDRDDLKITNVLKPFNTYNGQTKKYQPHTIILENFYNKPKLSTLSIAFTDRTIMLKDKLAQIKAAPNFGYKWETRVRTLHDIAFKQVEEHKNNTSIRARRSILAKADQSINSSASRLSSGIDPWQLAKSVFQGMKNSLTSLTPSIIKLPYYLLDMQFASHVDVLNQDAVLSNETIKFQAYNLDAQDVILKNKDFLGQYRYSSRAFDRENTAFTMTPDSAVRYFGFIDDCLMLGRVMFALLGNKIFPPPPLTKRRSQSVRMHRVNLPKLPQFLNRDGTKSDKLANQKHLFSSEESPSFFSTTNQTIPLNEPTSSGMRVNRGPGF